MNAAEEVLSVPELFDNITACLPPIDVVRIVRINQSCYQNARTSHAIKRKLFYLCPDDEEFEEPGEDEADTDESMTDDQPDPFAAAAAAQGQVNPNVQALRQLNMLRLRQGPPDHEPWPHTLDLRKINPMFVHIFPGGSIRNLSNNMALMTIPSSVYVAHGSRKVRLSWKAMLFTAQTCETLHITPAALYSARQGYEQVGGRFDDEGDSQETLPTFTTVSGGTQIGWIPGRGWYTDPQAHNMITQALKSIDEVPPQTFNPGSRNLYHWTEYVAKRRNEFCDGWVWGQSLEDFGLANIGFSATKLKKQGPKYGYFEEAIPAEDGLIRCGQVAREIAAADWCWWIIRIEPPAGE